MMELKIWTKTVQRYHNNSIYMWLHCPAMIWHHNSVAWILFCGFQSLAFSDEQIQPVWFFFKLLLKTNFGRSWYNCYLVFHVNYFSIPMLECSVPFYNCLNIHIQTHLQRYVTYMIHLRILTASLSALMLSENISWCWFSQSIRRLYLLHFLVYFLLHIFTQSILFCSEA